MQEAAATACICRKCGYTSRDEAEGSRCPNDGLALVSQAEDKAHPHDRFLGRVFGGKYPIVGTIGGGGMGAVYRAIQEPVGREVAVKIIHAVGGEGSAGDSTHTRFMREAQVVAALNSQATVRLYDYGADEDGTLYMVLELVHGQPLNAIIADEGTLAPRRVARIAFQVLNALAEAHMLGLIHRDIKPHNIMVEVGPFGEEQIKVLDFGIAKMMGADDVSTQSLTGDGIVGTPLYMPPEQAVSQGAEARSDQYALGCVMFEMLNGKPPFAAASTLNLLLAHRDSPVPELPEELGVPEPLRAVIRRAMQKKPEERFPDAAAMASALLSAVPDLGEVQPENTPQPNTGKRRPLRRPSSANAPGVARTPVGMRMTPNGARPPLTPRGNTPARPAMTPSRMPRVPSQRLKPPFVDPDPTAPRNEDDVGKTVARVPTAPLMDAVTHTPSRRAQPRFEEDEDRTLPDDDDEVTEASPSRRWLVAALGAVAVLVVGGIVYWAMPASPPAAAASPKSAKPSLPETPSSAPPVAPAPKPDTVAATTPSGAPGTQEPEPKDEPGPGPKAPAQANLGAADPNDGAEPTGWTRPPPPGGKDRGGTRRPGGGKKPGADSGKEGGRLNPDLPVENADGLKVPVF